MGDLSEKVIETLKAQASKDPAEVARRRRVPVENVLGVTTSDIRRLSRELRKDKHLAKQLWASELLEARALAILIISPKDAGKEQLNKWLEDISDWSTCDLLAKTLVSKRSDVLEIALDWIAQPRLYVRRAGLASLANFCIKNESFDDRTAAIIFEAIIATSNDDRPHVRQACCWVLREFGKSNSRSHEQACELALELKESDNATQQWLGKSAYRELEQLVKVPERRRLVSRRSKTAARQISTQ